MTFKIRSFDELTNYELYEIVRARIEVFLLEQNIICQDFDRVDYDSFHCFLEEDGEILAYLRAFREDSDTVIIGRVLSIKHKIGLGARLMREAMPEIAKRMPCKRFSLHAQTQAEGFYEKMGFKTVSDVFLEEGIPHVTMERDV